MDELDVMRRVLTLRFGLDGGPPQTLDEVEAELGVTRERVLQLETRALREPGLVGQLSEEGAALAVFDEFVGNAKGIPFTDHARLDRREAYVQLDRLRRALRRGSFEVAALLRELDELVRRAKPIPLRNEIRIERRGVYDVLERLRFRVELFRRAS